MKYMDLPLQHCSRQVLRAMNRQGDRESLSALIRKIREKVPGIVLRTTFMVGFPGETEEALRNWRNLPRKCGLSAWAALLIPRRKELRRQGCRIKFPGKSRSTARS